MNNFRTGTTKSLFFAAGLVSGAVATWLLQRALLSDQKTIKEHSQREVHLSTSISAHGDPITDSVSPSSPEQELHDKIQELENIIEQGKEEWEAEKEEWDEEKAQLVARLMAVSGSLYDDETSRINDQQPDNKKKNPEQEKELSAQFAMLVHELTEALNYYESMVNKLNDELNQSVDKSAPKSPDKVPTRRARSNTAISAGEVLFGEMEQNPQVDLSLMLARAQLARLLELNEYMKDGALQLKDHIETKSAYHILLQQKLEQRIQESNQAKEQAIARLEAVQGDKSQVAKRLEEKDGTILALKTKSKTLTRLNLELERKVRRLTVSMNQARNNEGNLQSLVTRYEEEIQELLANFTRVNEKYDKMRSTVRTNLYDLSQMFNVDISTSDASPPEFPTASTETDSSSPSSSPPSSSPTTRGRSSSTVAQGQLLFEAFSAPSSLNSAADDIENKTTAGNTPRFMQLNLTKARLIEYHEINNDMQEQLKLVEKFVSYFILNIQNDAKQKYMLRSKVQELTAKLQQNEGLNHDSPRVEDNNHKLLHQADSSESNGYFEENHQSKGSNDSTDEDDKTPSSPIDLKKMEIVSRARRLSNITNTSKAIKLNHCFLSGEHLVDALLAGGGTWKDQQLFSTGLDDDKSDNIINHSNNNNNHSDVDDKSWILEVSGLHLPHLDMLEPPSCIVFVTVHTCTPEEQNQIRRNRASSSAEEIVGQDGTLIGFTDLQPYTSSPEFERRISVYSSSLSVAAREDILIRFHIYDATGKDNVPNFSGYLGVGTISLDMLEKQTLICIPVTPPDLVHLNTYEIKIRKKLVHQISICNPELSIRVVNSQTPKEE